MAVAQCLYSAASTRAASNQLLFRAHQYPLPITAFPTLHSNSIIGEVSNCQTSWQRLSTVAYASQPVPTARNAYATATTESLRNVVRTGSHALIPCSPLYVRPADFALPLVCCHTVLFDHHTSPVYSNSLKPSSLHEGAYPLAAHAKRFSCVCQRLPYFRVLCDVRKSGDLIRLRNRSACHIQTVWLCGLVAMIINCCALGSLPDVGDKCVRVGIIR